MSDTAETRYPETPEEEAIAATLRARRGPELAGQALQPRTLLQQTNRVCDGIHELAELLQLAMLGDPHDEQIALVVRTLREDAGVMRRMVERSADRDHMFRAVAL